MKQSRQDDFFMLVQAGFPCLGFIVASSRASATLLLTDRLLSGMLQKIFLHLYSYQIQDTAQTSAEGSRGGDWKTKNNRKTSRPDSLRLP